MDPIVQKKVQDRELQILKEIDRICRLRHIRYCLCAGTLLGAVRHGGFIPWDDDIDIIMPRKDYERFAKEFMKYASDEYYLHTNKCDKKYSCLFYKVRLNGTKYGNERDKKLKHMGVWIDVFPLDFSNLSKFKFLKLIKRRNEVFTAYYANLLLDRKKRTNKWKIITLLPKSFVKAIDILSMSILLKILSPQDIKSSEYCCETFSTYNTNKVLYKSKEIMPFHPIKFCNLETFAPRNEKYYLRTMYGDYMKLPPKEKRVTNHDITIIKL